MKDFKLDMQVYDYKNDKHEVYGTFNKLKRSQLCFIQGLSIFIDSDDGKTRFGWLDHDIDIEILMEEATSNDIEEIIKEYFDNFNIKYDYVKVELL